MNRQIIRTSVIVGVSLLMPIIAFAQWTSAPANPPSSNVAAPINVSSVNQAKSGGLQVGSLVTDGGAVISGNLGVGLAPAYKLDVNGDANALRLCIGGDCRNAWPSGGSGGISSFTINTSGGITGGGTINSTGGSLTLSADLTSIQSRVTGTCVGQVMTGINQNGTVSCEPDDTGGAGALTLDNVIQNGGTTNRVPIFQGGIDLGNQDATGSDTAGIKAWNTISLYSTCCGYTTAAAPGILLNPRNGTGDFKGNVTTCGSNGQCGFLAIETGTLNCPEGTGYYTCNLSASFNSSFVGTPVVQVGLVELYVSSGCSNFSSVFPTGNPMHINMTPSNVTSNSFSVAIPGMNGSCGKENVAKVNWTAIGLKTSGNSLEIH